MLLSKLLNLNRGAFLNLSFVVLLLATVVCCGSLKGELVELKEIANAITSNWKSDEAVLSEIQLSFFISKDGLPYEISVLGGTDDPVSVQACISAVTLSTPFKPIPLAKSNSFLCSFKPTKEGIPRIVVQPKPNKEVLSDSRIESASSSSWNIYSLCELANQFPDSKKLTDLIDREFSKLNLNYNSKEDLLGFARGNQMLRLPPRVDKKSEQMHRAATHAFSRAFKESRDREILYELLDAYCLKEAIRLKEESNDNNVLLGCSAFLAKDYKKANSYFIRGKGTSSLSRGKYSRKKQLASKQMEWKSVLKLLPASTETVIFKRKLSNDLLSNIFFRNKESKSDVSKFEDEKQRAINEILTKNELSYCMHAAQNFRIPVRNSRVSPASQNLQIMVFKDITESDSQNIADILDKESLRHFDIGDIPVYCFEHAPWTLGQFGIEGRFACIPFRNIFVLSTTENYLRRFIARLSEEKIGIGLQFSDPALSDIDLDSDLWGFRHYHKSTMPFDFTVHQLIARMFPNDDVSQSLDGLGRVINGLDGFAFSKEGNQLTLKSFGSSKQIASFLIDNWKQSVFKESNNVRVLKLDSSFSVKGVPDSEGLIDVINELGYPSII